MTAPVGFRFDPSTVSATLEVLPKGEYEFKVQSAKPFLKQSGEDKHDSYGIRFNLVVTLAKDDAFVGKKVIYSTYFQSEGAQAMAKQFMMACLAYGKTRSEEERFNREKGSLDWEFDPNPESQSLGEAWTSEIVGSRVIGMLDVQPNNNTGEAMQNFKGWRSITSGPLN